MKKIMCFLVAAMLLYSPMISVHATSESVSSQDTTSIKEVAKTSKHDETVKRVFEKDGRLYKRIGNDITGYITIQDTFFRFKDMNNLDVNLIQYTLDGYNIITLTKVDLSAFTPEQLAEFDTKQVATNVIDGVEAINGEYEAGVLDTPNYDNEVFVSASMEGKVVLSFIFTPKGKDKEIYFISTEGTAEFAYETMDEIMLTWAIDE